MLAALIVALIVAGAVVGGAAVIGAPVLAVPVILMVLAGWLAVALGRRLAGKGPRADAPVRFSAADRATLVPSPSPAQRAENRRRSAEHAGGQGR